MKNANIKAGFAVADITPELGIYLTGYGAPSRLAKEILDPLNATVMVVEQSDTVAAIVGLDWCIIDWELTCSIRKSIAKASGIPEKNILLCCTHTHSAPNTTHSKMSGRNAADPEQKGLAYAAKVTPAIADAVRQARENCSEAKIGFAETKTQTGISRRGVDENGVLTAFFADPESIHDDYMNVMHFLDRKTGKDIGIFVHCSAHNTSLGGTCQISRDWCGVMKDRVSSQHGVPVLFVNGALGDSGPRTNAIIKKSCRGESLNQFAAGGGDGIESAREVGYRAATDTLWAIHEIKDYREDLSLAVATSKIVVPQAIEVPKDYAEKNVREIEAAGNQNEGDPDDPRSNIQTYYVCKAALNAWNRLPESKLELEQTLLAIGPLAIAPFPYEMFSSFSLRLRCFSPFQYTLLCSNTNGANGYMPDQEGAARGGYEVTSRKRFNPYVPLPEAGDSMTLSTLKNLRKLHL